MFSIILDDYIANYHSRNAEEFLRQIVKSISSDSEDYKVYCDDEDIENIEINKDRITINYKIVFRDKDNSILWWRFSGDEFRYQILFNEQYKAHVAIGSFPDGEFKVYGWSGPR